MSEPLWLDRRGLLLLHLESLAEHGGSSGMRDEGLLDSALARPRNQFIYDPNADIAKLAAAYSFALAKNHAFSMGTSGSHSSQQHFFCG
jgi:death-on-curing protein